MYTVLRPWNLGPAVPLALGGQPWLRRGPRHGTVQRPRETVTSQGVELVQCLKPEAALGAGRGGRGRWRWVLVRCVEMGGAPTIQ